MFPGLTTKDLGARFGAVETSRRTFMVALGGAAGLLIGGSLIGGAGRRPFRRQDHPVRGHRAGQLRHRDQAPG